MKVDTMRKIDRWVGVPITMGLSVLIWIKKVVLFQRKRAPDVSRTLFIELSEMGSAIIVDPAMRKLRKESNSELFFAIFEDNYKSLKLLNTVNEENIFKMNASSLFRLSIEIIRFIFWCRRKRITAVIDLELFSRFTAILAALSGAGTRIGFVSYHDEGLYRGSIINHKVRYNAHVHIAVNFISLIHTALGKHSTPYPTTEFNFDSLKLEKAVIEEGMKDNVRKKILGMYPRWKNEPLILINANASDLLPHRRWSPEKFAKVSEQIIQKYPGYLLIATGAPSEHAYVQDVVERVGSERIVNSAGLFEFEELAPLYSISKLMLTNDSGPAHFASVTDLKVFVLFGPETPALYLPLGNAEAIYLGLPCSPCVSAANHRKTTCETRPCMTGMPPDLVFNKIAGYLDADIQ